MVGRVQAAWREALLREGKTAVDGRTWRHPGRAISQCCRKRIEDGPRQVKIRGLAKVQTVFIFAIAAYNLVRIPKFLETT